VTVPSAATTSARQNLRSSSLALYSSSAEMPREVPGSKHESSLMTISSSVFLYLSRRLAFSLASQMTILGIVSASKPMVRKSAFSQTRLRPPTVRSLGGRSQCVLRHCQAM